jgi:ADP-heptose:LPS heptosyltransferase
VQIHHWPEAIDDYDETAALVAALDLVISVQTAVVHLAGGLGQPTWALISAVPEWRYGAAGEVMPWYPSVRLKRQQTLGEWGSVMKWISEDLSKNNGI